MPITRDHATILAEIRNPPKAARAPARWTELASVTTPKRSNTPMATPLPTQQTAGKNAGRCKRVRIETPAATSTRSDSTVVAELTTFIAARKHQVERWRGASQKRTSVARRNTENPRAVRRTAPGVPHLLRLLRLLFLLDINPDDRQERFEEECFRRALAPTTAATYWIAFAFVGVNGVLTTPAASRVTHELEKRAAEFPVKFPHALTMEQLCDFKQRFRDSASALVALVVASWALGQRFGDFIQPAVNDIMYDCQSLSEEARQ